MRIARIGLGLGLVSLVSFSGCGSSDDSGGDGAGGAGGSESTTGGSASGTGAAASDCEDLAIGTCTGGRAPGTGAAFPGVGGRASGGQGGASDGGQGGNHFAGSAGSGPGPEECSCTIARNPPASVDCDDVVWRCVGETFEGEDFSALGCADAGLGFMNAQRYCCPMEVDLCE